MIGNDVAGEEDIRQMAMSSPKRSPLVFIRVIREIRGSSCPGCGFAAPGSYFLMTIGG
jgi:hypothetical protein